MEWRIVKIPSLLLLAAVLAVGCSGTTGETLGQTIDDGSITSAVKAKLAAEQVSTLAGVNVSTTHGTVYLSGLVDNPTSRERAGEIARNVQGVRSVVNNLQVKTRG